MDASTGNERLLRFGSFALDVRARELRSGSARVRLQDQPFEILRMMLDRPGEVVTREDLRRRLWPNGTFVDFEHSLNAAVKRLRAALGDDADNPRFVETLPRRGYRFIARVEEADEAALEDDRAPAPKRVRLVVLPFANLSDDVGQDYFVDGLTEEMIAQLGRFCGNLGIIARHSSMVFKQTSCRVSEIGETLRAEYVLEGSVRRDGDRVRITARLVETRGETQLWTETYDRHLTDWLTVQADVAAGIASSLAIELVCDKRRPRRERLPEPTAYQAYLKGRYYWNMPADEGIEQAISYFADALRIDPTFAAAHASMARARILRAEYYGEQPRRALEQAQASAERALQLDPGQHRAALALGDVRRMLYWDWRGAEEQYRRAMALNPSSESVHRTYAVMLAALSRNTEAEREAQRALELDPLCLVVNTSVAWVRYLAGDLDAAVDRCRHVVDMSSRFMAARRLLGAAYLQMGRHAEAIAAFEEALASDADLPQIAWLAHAKGSSGDRRSARALVDRVLRQASDRHVSGYHLALAHVGVGDLDAAFAALDQACTDRDPVLLQAAVEPRLDPLRSDERYQQLLGRLGIPAADVRF